MFYSWIHHYSFSIYNTGQLVEGLSIFALTAVDFIVFCAFFQLVTN